MSDTEGAGAHMDAIYRTQRSIYDLTRKYFLLGRDHLIADLRPPPGGSVLEVACGTGRNLIAVARAYPEAMLFGFDISRLMLETAGANIARAGLGSRIIVRQGDATDFDPRALFGEALRGGALSDKTGFDRVLISYALSMIPPWQQAISAAFSVVKPGGRLHIVDFGGQAGLPVSFKRGLEAWLGHFSVAPRPDLREALEEVAGGRGTLRFTALYRDYAHYAVLERKA